MTFEIVNTTDWTFEQIAPYGRDITAHLKKLADKFPTDVTVESLAKDCMSGARQLWLVLDKEEIVAVCMTHIRTIDATGQKIVTLSSHAGNKGIDCVADMCEKIEAWAAEQGADYTAAEGRRGWGRELAKNGYKEYAVIWRKPIEAGQ